MICPQLSSPLLTRVDGARSHLRPQHPSLFPPHTGPFSPFCSQPQGGHLEGPSPTTCPKVLLHMVVPRDAPSLPCFPRHCIQRAGLYASYLAHTHTPEQKPPPPRGAEGVSLLIRSPRHWNPPRKVLTPAFVKQGLSQVLIVLGRESVKKNFFM